ncbi:hypothetical protein COV18_07275 [Candidatus Woesearchaeota archaeon CG10_big_fil_rev_8_21_14_0_10_37_12]|nr:MAG: hypothetical protein COV18_07275 [Candidatus Woesearchaeota archaeon CG10_big_fil_rev_8_21_14_0_10_37_12]
MIEEIVIEENETKHLFIVHDTSEAKEYFIRLSGRNASVHIDELFLSDAKSNIVVMHEAPNTKSEVFTRGIVQKNTTSYATIRIPKSMHGCDTFVSQKFLLLNDSAEVKAIPSLEIETDQVKAGHAASVAPLNDDKLFYLKSRGLPEKEARALLVEQFLSVPQDFKHLVEKLV